MSCADCRQKDANLFDIRDFTILGKEKRMEGVYKADLFQQMIKLAEFLRDFEVFGQFVSQSL